MSGHTRIVRVPSAPPAPPQSNTRTFVFGAGAPRPRETYLHLHRFIRSTCVEETRPGLFVFALHREAIVGRMWLAATEAPRVGTLGRHEATDLPLVPDAALSLRHVLFVVRLVDGQVRFSALDLETPGGLHTRLGAQHLTEAERPCELRTSALTFLCVPTGKTAALPMDADEARRQLDQPQPSRRPSFIDQFLRRGETEGLLTMHRGTALLSLKVDAGMLEQGVLIGRETRCDVIVPDAMVSRVHAVVLSIDGVPHLVDAGSSNGTWRHPGTRVKCTKLEDGDVFLFGHARVGWRAG